MRVYFPSSAFMIIKQILVKGKLGNTKATPADMLPRSTNICTHNETVATYNTQMVDENKNTKQRTIQTYNYIYKGN